MSKTNSNNSKSDYVTKVNTPKGGVFKGSQIPSSRNPPPPPKTKGNK